MGRQTRLKPSIQIKIASHKSVQTNARDCIMRRCLISGLAAFLLMLAPPAFAQSGKVNVTPVDCSAAIVTGGVAQNAFGTATGRQAFQIANLDTTEVMWISFTGTAVAGAIGSYPLAPATVTTFAGLSSYYSNYGFNTALSVIAATTAHKFSCTRW